MKLITLQVTFSTPGMPDAESKSVIEIVRWRLQSDAITAAREVSEHFGYGMTVEVEENEQTHNRRNSRDG